MASTGLANKKSQASLKGQRLDSTTWKQCMFWLDKKRRHCNLARVPGCELCGVHVNEGAIGASKAHFQEVRIPCPLDPSHTIFESQMKSHLKVCNALKKQKKLDACPYFQKNINSGHIAAVVNQEVGVVEANNNNDTGTEQNENVKLTNQLLISNEKMLNLIEMIDSIYEKQFPSFSHHDNKTSTTSPLPPNNNKDGIELRFTKANGCEDYIALSGSSKESKSRRAAYRHLLQQSSIVSNLEHRGLLTSERCFIELGAGRAMLALAINAAVPSASLILVERAAVRNKADRHLRKKRKHEEGPSTSNAPTSSSTDSMAATSEGGFFRARVDIRDLNLSGLCSPLSTDTNVDTTSSSASSSSTKSAIPTSASIVAVAKHLCGVATDLGLRSLLTASPSPHTLASTTSKEEGATSDLWPGLERTKTTHTNVTSDVVPNDVSVSGVCIATCCHHCCNWNDFVAKGFFQELGLNADHFQAMCKMSGWACNASNSSESSENISHKKQKSGSSHSNNETEDDEEDGEDDEHSKVGVISAPFIFNEGLDRRKEVGRKCKRLIDLGRLTFLRSLGMNAEVVHYCPDSISPENALLLAWRK